MNLTWRLAAAGSGTTPNIAVIRALRLGANRPHALTGVTVRALHHYDRLGLLQPRRTASGYHLYGRRELQRLEQIVALKFIGIPLQQIKAILDRNAPGLPDALRMQRMMLEEKRRLLDRAIQAIREAEQSFAAGGRPNAEILKKIIEVIEMQSNNDWTQEYYSAEALARIKEHHPEWTPASREKWREGLGPRVPRRGSRAGGRPGR